jgi:hypothetical protein
VKWSVNSSLPKSRKFSTSVLYMLW